MENIYHDYWQQELMYQFLVEDKCKKKAYVCSPYSAENNEGMLQNMRTARAYMFYALKKMGMCARAPHAFLPMLLCDSVPSERAIALKFGLELLERSDVLLVCGNRNGIRFLLLFVASVVDCFANQATGSFKTDQECRVFQMAGHCTAFVHIGIQKVFLLIGHCFFEDFSCDPCLVQCFVVFITVVHRSIKEIKVAIEQVFNCLVSHKVTSFQVRSRLHRKSCK